jgi:adenine-specific DNA-methyltransferase
MAKMGSKEKGKKKVETLTHKKASRLNIPTAEYQSVMRTEELSPVQVAYQRRNRDLDPQLVWRGKDEQDWSDLVAPAPPLYIQEKIHPKVLIDDLQRRSEATTKATDAQIDLFANFNGLPSEAAKTEFYQHDAHWANRMILGDSLQVMASLAEREGLRGRVQCIYFDPPYGIKFNSNFQWSTTSRDVKDSPEHITREPEQVKAFRDTWRDGIHSYLTYMRDRFTVARDLLTDSGSIFVQIGNENVHRVRTVMDEVFGDENCISLISYKTTQSAGAVTLDSSCDYILWYSKNRESVRFNNPLKVLERGDKGATRYSFAENTKTGEVIRESSDGEEGTLGADWQYFTDQGLTSRGNGSENTMRGISFQGQTYYPPAGHWRTSATLIEKRLIPAGRVIRAGTTIRFKKCFADFGCLSLTNLWDDVGGGIQSRNDPKIYVVQTSTTIVQRCLLMATNPGDLILDPTCGAGTTAYVAEQWGRRWITIDTSRVALALARARIMGARYPYYILADSREGQLQEAEITGKAPSEMPTHSDVRQGFVYERVPHITLKSIANNAEIDVIWDEYHTKLEPLRQQLNNILKTKWEGWEIPRDADEKWSKHAKELHAEWWKERIARQQAIDASIAAKAEFEYLFDKPYEDNKKVRVAGPFTVESLSPHRVLSVGEDDEFLQKSGTFSGDKEDESDFVEMILENLKTSGVQQAHKEDKITFSSIAPWPGYFVCAEGKYSEGNGKSGAEKRAAIFVGPEFGTVSRPDLVAAAREAGDAGFDVLITCAFNYDAHSSEFNKLGKIPVLKARMNADLHMSDELKNTGKGNLFVIFGEPDIEILKAKDGQIQVKIIGVDVFHPNTGEVRSDGAEGIACWFVDTDYNEESFFVRQAYFLGTNDPYKALKTTLKAEINEEAWATLRSDTSRPFDKPKSDRIAVKVINHLGDEVMKVFKV